MMIKDWGWDFVALKDSTASRQRLGEDAFGLRCDNSWLGCCGFSVETEVENFSTLFCQTSLLCHVSPGGPSQTPPRLLIHIVRGLEGQLALRRLFPAQTLGLIPALVQVCCGCEYGTVRCFVPHANSVSTEVTDVPLVEWWLDQWSVTGFILWFVPVRKENWTDLFFFWISLCKNWKEFLKQSQVPLAFSSFITTYRLLLRYFQKDVLLQTHFTHSLKSRGNKVCLCMLSYAPWTADPKPTVITARKKETEKERPSLTASRYSDFTQEMSIEREIEGQINSLWRKNRWRSSVRYT